MKPAPKPVHQKSATSRNSGKVKTPHQLYLKAHELVRQILLIRDKQCFVKKANHSTILQNGHLFTKTRPATKIDLRNCNLQCSGCNGIHTRDYLPYEDSYIETYGQADYDQLKADSKTGMTLKRKDYETAIVELKEILRMIQMWPDWKPRFTQQQILSGEWRMHYPTKGYNNGLDSLDNHPSGQ